LLPLLVRLSGSPQPGRQVPASGIFASRLRCR